MDYGFLNSLSFPNNISQETPLRIWRVRAFQCHGHPNPFKSAKTSSPQTEPATNTRPPCIQTPRRTTKRAPWVPNIYFVPGKFLSTKNVKTKTWKIRKTAVKMPKIQNHLQETRYIHQIYPNISNRSWVSGHPFVEWFIYTRERDTAPACYKWSFKSYIP